ncbi:Leucine Rich Repeat [Seminavis robusta]|uniref:Leucine Rich Repeat n=1 Tax=Seminavis robusta TaxID=568900 RepID=A0A9N8E8Y0_9STRA|nr:Leucine Rich Repeat [Seminavis robusta]|eukprot:Sro638_g179650.1 Leucine Rich Repeat (699) ;mRNA; r:44247-46440
MVVNMKDTAMMKEAESPLRQAMNVAASTDDYDPLTGIMLMPQSSGPQNDTSCPGAYSHTPGMQVQRATTPSRSSFLGPIDHHHEDNDDADEEVGVPSPRVLSSSTHNDGPADAQPRAVNERSSDPEDESQDESPRVGEENGLAVAQLVDEISPHKLPRAQTFDGERAAAKRRDQKTRQIRTIFLLGMIILVVIVIILLAILIPRTGPTKTATIIVPPPAPITAAPTSAQGFLLSLLDKGTLRAMEDTNSPQFKAHEWLLEDSDQLPFCSKERLIQKFALATLYFATNGDHWEENTHWLNHSIHECEWFQKPNFAVKDIVAQFVLGYLDGFLEPPPSTPCDNNGLFQHLWLDVNTLVGSLPTEVYMLTSLKTLSLDRNQLEGTISSHIGRMTNLQGLSLSGMLQTGTIPTEIGLLTNLNILFLDTNQLNGQVPTELWKLTNLVDLALSANYDLEGTLPSEISAISKLRWFLSEQSEFTGTIPSELGNLPLLEVLVLAESRHTGVIPSELGKLTALSVLTFQDNSLEGSLPTELGLLTALTVLRGNNNMLSGPLCSELGLLKDLEQSLSFHFNMLSGQIPTELGLFQRLPELVLHNNQFSGQIPSEFGELVSLQLLSLANNSLSGLVPEEFAYLQPHAHTIRLDGNPLLSGHLPADLCALNGTCSSDAWNPCIPPFGFVFDCTEKLCGCGCICEDLFNGP